MSSGEESSDEEPTEENTEEPTEENTEYGEAMVDPDIHEEAKADIHKLIYELKYWKELSNEKSVELKIAQENNKIIHDRLRKYEKEYNMRADINSSYWTEFENTAVDNWEEKCLLLRLKYNYAAKDLKKAEERLREIKVDEAEQFVYDVETEFGKGSTQYAQFVEIMANKEDVRKRVGELLAKKPVLLEQFKKLSQTKAQLLEGIACRQLNDENNELRQKVKELELQNFRSLNETVKKSRTLQKHKNIRF